MSLISFIFFLLTSFLTSLLHMVTTNTNNDNYNNRLLVALLCCLASVTWSDVKLAVISQNKTLWSDSVSVIWEAHHCIWRMVLVLDISLIDGFSITPTLARCEDCLSLSEAVLSSFLSVTLFNIVDNCSVIGYYEECHLCYALVHSTYLFLVTVFAKIGNGIIMSLLLLCIIISSKICYFLHCIFAVHWRQAWQLHWPRKPASGGDASGSSPVDCWSEM